MLKAASCAPPSDSVRSSLALSVKILCSTVALSLGETAFLGSKWVAHSSSKTFGARTFWGYAGATLEVRQHMSRHVNQRIV